MTGSERDREPMDIDGDPDGDVGWPARLRGVTESIVTTLGPNDRWNCAALGLLANGGHENGETGNDDGTTAESDSLVTARTWGRTRTWRNFREEGKGYVQFVRDPVVFTEAALSIREERSPVLRRARPPVDGRPRPRYPRGTLAIDADDHHWRPTSSIRWEKASRSRGPPQRSTTPSK